MSSQDRGPRNKEENKSTGSKNNNSSPQREGADDALAERNPSDSRMDEKVVVNEQSEQKIVNSPSQTDAHPNEGVNRVDEI